MKTVGFYSMTTKQIYATKEERDKIEAATKKKIRESRLAAKCVAILNKKFNS